MLRQQRAVSTTVSYVGMLLLTGRLESCRHRQEVELQQMPAFPQFLMDQLAGSQTPCVNTCTQSITHRMMTQASSSATTHASTAAVLDGSTTRLTHTPTITLRLRVKDFMYRSTQNKSFHIVLPSVANLLAWRKKLNPTKLHLRCVLMIFGAI